MRADYKIAVRDAVDFFYDKSPQYKALVHDVKKDGTLLVPVPSYLNTQMPLKKGQELSMAFYRETGKYVVGVKVKDIKKISNVEYVLIKIISEPVKEQRRNYYRLPVSLKVGVYPYEEAPPGGGEDGVEPSGEEIIIETVRTNNISISGISIKTKREYNIGQRYKLKVYLAWPNELALPTTVWAEVRRVSYDSVDEVYSVGMHYVNQKELIGEHIGKYILAQQKKLIRQKRLVEGS